MRCAIAVVVAAACSPDIAPGAYFCGPERSCPPDQACDGTGVCVLAESVGPFACDLGTDPEPDDTPGQAIAAPALACVSTPYVKAGCLHDGDPADWVSLAIPATCTAVEVQVRITYAIGFEPVAIELWDLSGNQKIASGGGCVGSLPSAGDDDLCITVAVQPGGHYGLVVKPAGGGDCGGGCAYNRYNLTVQLATPG